MTERKSGWDRVVDLREVAKSGHRTGLDGIRRSADSERKLNALAAEVFKSKAGQEWIDYVRSITMNTVTGAGIEDCALRHLEGQRYQVALTLQRIERGKKGI